jgi:hypothetical protein
LRRRCPFRYRKPLGHQADMTKIKTLHRIFKTINAENKERILKAVRQKNQITNKGKPTKITDFSKETLKTKKGMD